ncbi:hypothetical protein DFH11DRAFT_1606462 [Phellopilus nigrolimitatus]|nr:hypothetical protein DFH11DRAFT_1606462 [Phellopilus nigrolimitatus]
MFKTHTDLIFASTLLGLDNTTRIPFRAIDAILDLLHHPGFKPAELTFARSEDVYAAYSSAALTARLRTDVREARISRVVLDLVAEHLAPKLEPFADSLSNSKDQQKRTEEASALESMALVIGTFSLRRMLQSAFVVSGTLELKFFYGDADPPDDAYDSCRALTAILQRTPFLRSLFVKMPFDSIDGHSIALLLQELQNLKYLESLWLVQDTYKFNNHLPALCGALPDLPELKNLWIERWCIPREDAPSISLSEEALPACRISSLSYIGKRGDIYMNSYSLVPELGITGNTFGIFDAVLPTLESLRLCLASTCDEALGAFFAKCTALKHLRLDIDLARQGIRGLEPDRRNVDSFVRGMWTWESPKVLLVYGDGERLCMAYETKRRLVWTVQATLGLKCAQNMLWWNLPVL